MKFYGRKNELAIINGWFRAAKKGALFTAIIGRRRIGKTRLWLEAGRKKKNCRYLLCLPGPLNKTFEQVEPQLYEIGFTSVPRNLSEFFKAGSVFKNREGIEIDFLPAAEKENRIHAYEIKRGNVDRRIELNRLMSKVARLKFKSIRIHNPEISGKILMTKDI